MKKTILITCCILCVMSLVAPSFAGAITFRELLEKPLPDVGAFVAKVWDWFGWLWGKIVQIVNVVLNWALDHILAYIWKILVWAWNLIKTTFVEAWHAFLYFWGLLEDNTFIDWGNIAWPWD